MHPEPEEKFSKTKVEYALKPLLEKELETIEYDAKNAVQLSKDISAKILEHIKRTFSVLLLTKLDAHNTNFSYFAIGCFYALLFRDGI